MAYGTLVPKDDPVVQARHAERDALLVRFLAFTAHREIPVLEAQSEIDAFWAAISMSHHYVPQITRPRGFDSDMGRTFYAPARVLLVHRAEHVRVTWQRQGKEPSQIGRRWNKTDRCLLLEDLANQEITELVTGGTLGMKFVTTFHDLISIAARLPWLEPWHLTDAVRRSLRGRKTLVVS